jgi:choline kinase
MFKLDENTTVMQRTVQLIKRHDSSAEIVVVVGFMKDEIMDKISGVSFVINPFYAVTNSIASLWFARNYLNRENVVIINGDIVAEDRLVKDIICNKFERPTVLLDSSIRSNGDYNVQVYNNEVVVMSKDLEEYYGEYAGITMLTSEAAKMLLKMANKMIDEDQYDQWYENAIVQLIFRENFVISYVDIVDYRWTEVDTVSDLMTAKEIYHNDH